MKKGEDAMDQTSSPMLGGGRAHLPRRAPVRAVGDPITAERRPYPEITVPGAPVPDAPLPGQPPFPETPIPGAPPSPRPTIPAVPDEPVRDPTQPEIPPAPDLPGVPPLPGQPPEPEMPRYHRRIPSHDRAAPDGALSAGTVTSPSVAP